MTKIMLVEDDKSLREIYGVRLLAEGYDIVSAGDGEEALAMAIKERPQLIVSDVMMPKISGFDMLDILRSTTETKNIKVIMMTALSSEEQRKRGESLGADRYLVKSQVGIEDVVRVVHEVLDDAPVPAPAQPATEPIAAPAPTQPQPVTPTSVPATAPASAPQAPGQATPQPASLKSRVIQPLSDPSVPAVDINALLDRELAKEAGITDDARPEVQTTTQEKDAMNQALSDFQPNAPVQNASTVTIDDNGTPSYPDETDAAAAPPAADPPVAPTPTVPTSMSAPPPPPPVPPAAAPSQLPQDTTPPVAPASPSPTPPPAPTS